MRALIFGLALVGATSAQAAPAFEGSFDGLADWTFEDHGVRVSNCHIVNRPAEAKAACYVLNKTPRPVRVRVVFGTFDSRGGDVAQFTLATTAFLGGEEITQIAPVTAEEWDRMTRARVSARVLP